jgi:hypothetical protein
MLFTCDHWQIYYSYVYNQTVFAEPDEGPSLVGKFTQYI